MMRGNHIVSLLIVSGVASVLLLDGNALFRLPAQRTAVPVDDLLFQGLQDPFALLIPAFAPYRGLRLSEPPQAYESYVVPGMFLSLIPAITMGLANVSGRMSAYFMKKADLLISVTSMLHVMTKAKMYAVGLLIMLNAVAVSFTQMVTARV